MIALELANARALSNWLSELGYRALPQRLLERARGMISPDFVVAVLREHGQCARKVRAGALELALLELPTLVLLHSGEALVLESLCGGQAVVRDATGRRTRTALTELARKAHAAIDRGTPGAVRSSLLEHLLGVLAGTYASQTWLLVVSLSGAAVSLVLPWLTRLALGRVLPDEASSLLVAVVAAVAACACLKAWLDWLVARTRPSLDAQVVRSTSLAVFRRALSLPYDEHQKRGLGGLLQTLVSSQLASRRFSNAITTALLEWLKGFAYIVCLTASAPSLGLMLAGLAGLACAFTYLLSRRSARLRVEELEHAARARASLHEAIQGILTIKAARAEGYGLSRWLRAVTAERGLGLSRELADTWLLLSRGGLERVANLAVLARGARAVLDGDMAVADIVYQSMLGTGFLHAIGELNRELSELFVARPHFTRVNDLLTSEPAPPPLLEPPRVLETDAPVIELSDVWFRYGPNEPWILKDYSLKVQRHELLKLRGKSGAGKTTVLRLIAGLYRPERGTVSVFGKDPWRNRSAAVYLPQDAHLMTGSIRHNLQQLSLAGIDRVRAACIKTGLDAWLESLPMGLETLLAPGGANVSGGQRQWIVLTAAVASERPIVLLDEAMSQLDHAVRRTLSEAQLFPDRTCVSVAHDG